MMLSLTVIVDLSHQFNYNEPRRSQMGDENKKQGEFHLRQSVYLGVCGKSGIILYLIINIDMLFTRASRLTSLISRTFIDSPFKTTLPVSSFTFMLSSLKHDYQGCICLSSENDSMVNDHHLP